MFDNMHNNSRLLKQPKQQAIIYYANVCFHFKCVFKLHSTSFGFDDILNCCLCQGKLTVTATNVSV